MRLLALLSAILAIAFTKSGIAADAQKGETLAKRWCATCHVISSSQQQGASQAPPFSAIASKPNFNETTVAYFLLAPHPRMPDMNLTRAEAADLAAYIARQK